jgi:uncharacterized phage infection (PIP) family protein YhgE
MASKRELKKDVDYLIYEVFADCFAYKEVFPNDKTDKITEIVNDAVGLRNDLFARINNPDGKANKRITKTYFQLVRKDLLEGVDKLFGRLSVLAAAK